MNHSRLLVFVILFYKANGELTQWQYTTACYGADPDCSEFKIECGTETTIVIGSLQYGGKKSPRECQFGISDCDQVWTIHNMSRTVNLWCCEFDPGDYLADFNPENRTSVVKSCNGRRKCSGSVPRILMTAYTSYARIQYACVDDNSTIEICKASTTTGNNLFVTSNHLPDNPSPIGPRDCTCRVHALDCYSNLELTPIDVNLNSTGSIDGSGCSNAYLELGSSHTFRCAAPMNLPSRTISKDWNSTIALRHLFWNGTADSPNAIMIQVKAEHTRSPVTIECFEPGIEPNSVYNCPSSITSTLPTSSSYLSTLTSRQTLTTQKNTLTAQSTDIPPQHTSKITSLDTSQPSPTASTNPTVVSTQANTPANIPNSAITTDSKDNQLSTHKTTIDIATKDTMQSVSTTTDVTASEQPTTTAKVSSSDTIPPSVSVTRTRQSTASSLTPRQSNSTATHAGSTVSSLQTTASLRVTSSHPLTKLTTAPVVTNESDISAEVTVNTVYSVHGQSTPGVISTTGENDSANNNTLIIGLTIGAVLVILLVVALIACCCYLRLKRKENVERNYVRNTNIFYSYPEEYTVTENMAYEPVVMDASHLRTTEVIDLRKSSYHTVGNESPTLVDLSSPPTDDSDSKIRHKQSNVVNGGLYQTDVANGTVEFINGTAPDVTSCAESVHNGKTHGTLGRDRSLTFDPFSLYSRVRKDGKTKF